MSNSGPILPIIAAEAVVGKDANGSRLIIGENVDGDEERDGNLDDGETNDSQETVSEDLREGDDVNDKLDE